MIGRTILDELQRLDIRLEAQGERLLVDAPQGVLTDDLRARLRAHKQEILVAIEQTAQDRDSARAVEERRSLWGDGPCFACGSARFWHRSGGPLVCARCHPHAATVIANEMTLIEKEKSWVN